MSHLEIELQSLREELFGMWELVFSQLRKAGDSLREFGKTAAREVVQDEKNVNAFELQIDRHCENIFALHYPVAVDLRFVLAVLKINYNLERIGDYAEGIARIVIEAAAPFTEKMWADARLPLMLEEASGMIDEAREALAKEDTGIARKVLDRDHVLDSIHSSAAGRLLPFVQARASSFPEALSVYSIIQKLERIGDQTTNIAEEIIFYLEAKVLKHQQGK
jgi:phosphate transport system protein